MLVFDSKRFFKQRINGEKMVIQPKIANIIRGWDGKKVHKYAKNSVKRIVFGENLYIMVGSEKIGVSEEFTRYEQRQ